MVENVLLYLCVYGGGILLAVLFFVGFSRKERQAAFDQEMLDWNRQRVVVNILTHKRT